MVSYKNRMNKKRSRKHRRSPAQKQETTWFGGLFSIIKKGGRVTRKVTKTTVYKFEVSDD